MNKPHILIVITKSDLGGAQIHVLGLLAELSNQYRFTLAAGEPGFLTRECERMGIDVLILRNLKRPINLIDDYRGLVELRQLLSELNPDIVHLHSSKAGVLGRLAATSTGKQSIFTAHGWAFTEGAGWKQRSYGLLIEWLLGLLPSTIISVSDYDYHLASYFRVGRNHRRWVIKNGIGEFSGQQPDWDQDRDKPVHILNIGRMSRAKNQLLLIEAFAKMRSKVNLEIIGEGHLEPMIQSRANSLGVADRILFSGPVENIVPSFEKCQIFALSSDYEGLPLSVLEAMSAGKPVVATDVGGVKEAVVHGESGLLSERGNADAFASHLDMLVEDVVGRQRMGEAGRRRYLQLFKLERMVKEVDKVYETVLR
ncbi:MAG: glycosyltransferase family 4 protein [Pseudomonadota bacterium]